MDRWISSRVIFFLLALLGSFSCARSESLLYTIEPTSVVKFGMGAFMKKEGTLRLDFMAKSGDFSIQLDTTSVSTGLHLFDANLQGLDFLDVEHYPTSSFIGNTVLFQDSIVSEVQGDLTIRGITNPVSFQVTSFQCKPSESVCIADFTTTLDRSLFGITYGLRWGLSPMVKLSIHVEARKVP